MAPLKPSENPSIVLASVSLRQVQRSLPTHACFPAPTQPVRIPAPRAHSQCKADQPSPLLRREKLLLHADARDTSSYLHKPQPGQDTTSCKKQRAAPAAELSALPCMSQKQVHLLVQTPLEITQPIKVKHFILCTCKSSHLWRIS